MGTERTTQIAVIMAGGLGERFWPVTHSGLPKYAMKFNRHLSLLEGTYQRLRKLFPKDKIYVITTLEHRRVVQRLLPRMKSSRILAEPERRNTAGAVTFATYVLKKKYGSESVLSFYPADARIKPENKFIKIMRTAINYASSKDELVVLGIRPSYPATGYGYIECGKRISGTESKGFGVKRFVEKPNRSKAKQFLRQKRFLWNAGIFVWKIRVFNETLSLCAPHFHRSFQHAFDSPRFFPQRIHALFKKIPAQPIDRVLLEKAKKIAVFKTDFKWDDIGTWTALRRMESDSQGNVITSKGVFDDVEGCVVMCEPNFRIAVSGIRDIIIAQRGRRLLVCHVGRSQDVTRLKRRFEKKFAP